MTNPRLWRALLGNGFRAAPGWMWATLALAMTTGVAAAAYPYGFRLFTDAVIRQEWSGLVAGSLIGGGLIAVHWAAATLDANVGFGLTDRLSLYISSRIAELVNAVPGLEHFERPEYLQELDLVLQNQSLLAGAPRQTITTLQTVLRGSVVIALLATVDPRLAAMPLLGIVPAYAQSLSVRIRQSAEERMAELKRLSDQLFALASTGSPAKEVRVYGLGPELARRHDDLAARIERATTIAAIKGGAVGAAGWLVFVAGFVASLAVIVNSALQGRATPGEVVMAVVLAQQVRLALAQMATAAGQLLTTVRTVKRLFWLEDFAATAIGRDDSASSAVPARLTSGIRFRAVSFRYPGTEVDVLRDVDLMFPAGATVALIGDNGAGKTTIAKLLTRMYDPTSGAIEVDGRDLATLPLAEWRMRSAAATQDFARFELVASESVGVGDLPRIDDARAVATALERADATELVTQLGDGLETQLGRSFPAGRELSGGQWQKIALGRSMMRDEPLLLVLDEPTASLDAEAEYALFNRYADAAKRARETSGAITILVSHRFSTVRNADLIVVLEAGRVIESGTHSDLLARRGTYAELFELQAAAYR